MQPTQAFLAWLPRATKGESFVYFRGDLSMHREGYRWTGKRMTRLWRRKNVVKAWREHIEVQRLAELADEAKDAGVISLTRRRLGENDYEYIAQRQFAGWAGRCWLEGATGTPEMIDPRLEERAAANWARMCEDAETGKQRANRMAEIAKAA